MFIDGAGDETLACCAQPSHCRMGAAVASCPDDRGFYVMHRFYVLDICAGLNWSARQSDENLVMLDASWYLPDGWA